ncbi:MAG: Gfo/Idh/MocA family oxidoreductase [Clostridiales bacterium]|nr:Gfo/Idh/MocA family oxidoreductase [Clostridiales bacterium]
MKKVTVAVIGCGAIARDAHMPSYANNPMAEVKYVVDIKPEKAKALGEKYRVPHIITDYREILQDPEVEAVSVCTPNDTHAPITIDCLNAGKNVLCEKPAAINADLVRKMKEAADRNGKILNIGVVNRFNTAVNHIKDMIEAGELGKVYHIYCSFRQHRSIPGLGGWFTNKKVAGGGVLIDWGVHFLDLIFYCINPKKVLAVSSSTYSELVKDLKDYTYVDMWAGPPDYDGVYDVEEFVTGLIRTDGPTISFNGAWAQNIGESAMFIEFLGDKGGIKLEYGGNFTFYTTKNGILQEIKPSYQTKNMFYEEIDSFLKSTIANRKNRANVDNILITAETMDAIYESAKLGKEVIL